MVVRRLIMDVKRIVRNKRMKRIVLRIHVKLNMMKNNVDSITVKTIVMIVMNLIVIEIMKNVKKKVVLV
jgi:hypothetical protein